jgi:DNA-dependent protein kinase catalytic subunit
VSDKLNGINPCVITHDDLKNGVHRESRFLKYYINAALGGDLSEPDWKIKSERCRILKNNGPKYRLSVEEQVQCIIEQSTDLNILGRTWLGWQPFI